MKKATLIAIATLMFALMSSLAVAQAGQTAGGTLAVSATVNSSINLIFNSDSSGVALSSGAGTNTATLAFGTVSALGPIAAGITRNVVAGTSFSVSTPVDVQVNKANLTSANYTLTAKLNSVDATNTWSVGGTTINGTTAATITSTGTYGSNTAHAIAISVPDSVSGGTLISNTISFLATSN